MPEAEEAEGSRALSIRFALAETTIDRYSLVQVSASPDNSLQTERH